MWAFFVAFKTKFVHPFIRQFSRSVIHSLARVSRNSCSGVVVFWFDMAESVRMSGSGIVVANKDWEKGIVMPRSLPKLNFLSAELSA